MTVTSIEGIRQVSYPEAPVAEKIEGTLLDIIQVPEMSQGQSWLDGVGLFPTYNCLTTGIVLGETCGPVSASKFSGVDSPAYVDGFKFAAYGTTVCKLDSLDALRNGTEAAYKAAESRMVEAALMENVFAANSDTTPTGDRDWVAATNLTPGASTTVGVDPVVGVGILESHMARNYAGKGVLHMPRSIATVLDSKGTLDWDGSMLLSSLHTPVAAGAGYDYPNLSPTGTEAPEGTKWIYATGNVIALRQSLRTQAMLNIYAQSADDEAPNYIEGLEPNDMIALSEGVYLIAVDCYKAAILVNLYEGA